MDTWSFVIPFCLLFCLKFFIIKSGKNHSAIHQKITQHCKATILQFNKKKKNKQINTKKKARELSKTDEVILK